MIRGTFFHQGTGGGGVSSLRPSRARRLLASSVERPFSIDVSSFSRTSLIDGMCSVYKMKIK